MRNAWRVVAGTNSSAAASSLSMEASASRAKALTWRPRSVGTMPALPRTSSGSSKMTRRRFRAALTAGCDWLSLIAVRDTLRSATSAHSTRMR